jgi:ribosomal protein S18 acetylase RimI-like enzyme
VRIRQIDRLEADALRQLTRLLVVVVDDGASIGFLPPLAPAEARAYWRGVLGPGVVLLVAEGDEGIVGTVQLHCALRPNGRHRAEVAKLMVHPTVRRQGVARRLMAAIEDAARAAERRLLVLDTREGDPANGLYRSLGYTEAGRIPGYALSGDGGADATVIYYKQLA